VKAAGFFGDESERYSKYRKAVEAKGWHYFYLTLCESYKPYVQVARNVFGENRAYFLDQKESWDIFIYEIVLILELK